MENIQIFNNPEFGQIRTITIDGEPWFVGNDVSRALGYAKPKGAIQNHVDPEDKQVAPIQDPLKTVEMMVINESGLYSLIFGSKLETAKKFKHWVTSEVLPQIRKTGTYALPQQSPSEIPLGELASYLKAMDRVANRQNLAPYKIAENFKKVSRQFGVELTDDFVNMPNYEQLELVCSATLEGGAGK